MNLNEEVELLKLVPIFSKIEQAKLKLLAFTSERVNFAVGQEVCHQGDPGDTMYVILGGTVVVVVLAAAEAAGAAPSAVSLASCSLPGLAVVILIAPAVEFLPNKILCGPRRISTRSKSRNGARDNCDRPK